MLPGHCDRDLVETDRVVEHQLVQRLFPESRLRRSMSHRLRVWPRAVEAREVTGPEEVLQADLGHATKSAFFLHLEREEHLTLHELGRLPRENDVGFEDAGRWASPVVL